MNCQLHTPPALPRYQLYRTLIGLQSRTGHGGEEKESLRCPCWVPNPRPSHSLVTRLTEIPGSLKIVCTKIVETPIDLGPIICRRGAI